MIYDLRFTIEPTAWLHSIGLQSSIVNRHSSFDDRPEPHWRSSRTPDAGRHVRLRDSGRHAADAGFLSSRSSRASVRSTGRSSRNCPNPSAKPAAAWPTPSSARLFCSAQAAVIGVPVGVLGGVFLSEYGGDKIELVDPVRRRHSERRAVHHLGHRGLWR